MPAKIEPGLPIGRIAERCGVPVSAIRYYADRGLLHPVRTAGGTRQFRRSDIRRVSFVLIAQRLGLDLMTIQDILSGLPQDRTPTKADWSKISKQIRIRLDAQIAELTRVRDTLDGCIGCGCLSLSACKLYNPDDSAADDGPGPRVLR